MAGWLCALAFGFGTLDGAKERVGFIRTQPKSFSVFELNFDCIKSRDIVKPAVRGEMNAPAIAPRISHHSGAFNICQWDGFFENAGAKFPDQEAVTYLNGKRVKQDCRDQQDAKYWNQDCVPFNKQHAGKD